MPTYHPWREARKRSHLIIEFVDDLPAGMRGRIRGDVIEVNGRMLADERRCTIAHELVHDERRLFPSDPVMRAKEEAAVEIIAARRLIAVDQLVDVLCWTRDVEEVAAELWVDVAMLASLADSLTADERLWIEKQLRERGVW